MKKKPTVVVVGGGHAGSEAAAAAARLGCKSVLITPDVRKISMMSCNPSIGGIAKGTLVREIDALGGIAAKSADSSALQFRMLNRKKGPAVWGPRVQADTVFYSDSQLNALKGLGVLILSGQVVALHGPNHSISGVYLSTGEIVFGDAFVLAVGTFLRGMLHRGRATWPGGRRADISAVHLESDLVNRMFHVKRFKTGTSPRILRNSIDFASLEKQEPDDENFRFSWSSPTSVQNKELCWITRTKKATENIVKNSLKLSALYSGRKFGKGPRYCPSFEDKVVKFPERTGHPIHVEPMSKNSRLIYLNGLSTSMPQQVQDKIVGSLDGFRDAVIAAYGYTVEYSCFETGEFDRTLRLRGTQNLYAAGQLLGTSGYEEAAATGLLAGANAARNALEMDELVPNRLESYLGVMVDDLAIRGTDEPYRLFSSRSENRLYLRQDNADRRVFSFARKLGTLSNEEHRAYIRRSEDYENLRKKILNTKIEGESLESICKRPEVSFSQIAQLLGYPLKNLSEREILQSVVLDVKYAGYIRKAERRWKARKRYGDVSLASISDYSRISTITIEASEALNRIKPSTLHEAESIPAVRQADMDGLVLFLMKESVSRET